MKKNVVGYKVSFKGSNISLEGYNTSNLVSIDLFNSSNSHTEEELIFMTFNDGTKILKDTLNAVIYTNNKEVYEHIKSQLKF